jgi:hypothetical protein
MPLIIIAGDILNGHRFIGPFADETGVTDYVEVHEGELGRVWVAVALIPPDDPAQAHRATLQKLIIVGGDMLNGFRFIGPFADEAGVNAYADADPHDEELEDLWISVALEPPDDPSAARPQRPLGGARGRQARRWHATVTYRTDDGPLEVEHDFEELRELHDLVELGPHWDTIIKIVVTLARRSDEEHPDLTVEQALKL